ncbi:ABC transporter ATP-binding protein [Acidovorax sp. YS12]|nr:ABC transporter ATP-binding protein [Acidovorax sp. YS12]
MLQRSPLLRCLALYRRTPLLFLATVALFAVLNLSLSWQQWLVGRAVNDVASGQAVTVLAGGGLDYGGPGHGLWHWVLVIVGVAAARGVLQYGTNVLAQTIGQRLMLTLREMILVQVQRLHLGYHLRHGMGEMVTRTTRDADKVRDAFITFWRQVVDTVFVVLAAVGLLCWYDPWLGVVALGLTLVGIALFIQQTGRLVELDRAVGEAYDRVNQDLSEGISGVRVIKSFGLEARRIGAFSAQVGVFAAQARAALWYASTRIPVPQVVVAMAHVWILAYGAWLVGQGRMGLGELTASLLIATTLVFRIEGIGRVMQAFADARSSAGRIWEMLDAQPAIVSGAGVLPAGPLGVRLDGVGLSLVAGGAAVLEDCSLAVAPGEFVAVVGGTGSGKSTLAALLPRFLDAERGSVRLGTAGGTEWLDVRMLDLPRLRQRVHLVTQETFLFSDTLGANLRMAAPDASDAQLRTALHRAALDDLLEQLPEGFDTLLGDRGVTLSGGQRQRLSLARALLARPDLLVLDDATSALDAVTERRILDGIRRTEGAPTIVLVASKLSTVLQADRVVMLAGGRVVANGTHEALAARHEGYRQLMGLDHGAR